MPRDLAADLKMLSEVRAYAENRDWSRAGAMAEQALSSGFEHPLLLNVAATCLEQGGRFEEAVRLLERAITIAPDDVGARNALAMGLQRVGRPAEALHHADELLKRHPELGFAHANRGNALLALGWLGQARSSHLRALELEPGNVAVMAALASIASHRGRHDEARGWAARVLVAVPNFPDAVLSLAAAELAGGAVERAETLLRQLLADGRVAAIDQARAQGLLGDVLDAAGRHEAAFAAYSTCNDRLRRIHAGIGGGGALAYARTLTTAFASATCGDWSAGAASEVPSGALGHVFLISFPRSGTTLLEVSLDGHPRVASLDEHELLTDAVVRYLRHPPELDALLRADDRELAALRAAYWQRVRRAGVDPTGKVFVDKHPLNTLKLPLIARLFPRAKVLFVRRDPRDVVLACFRRRFRMNAATYELLTLPGAAAFYDVVMEFAARARPVLGLDWRDVGLERLLGDFDGEMAAICGFLGLDPVAGLGDFGARAQSREHATPSTAQLARGLDRSGAGHWRRYAVPLEPVLPLLDPWVERFGYPR